jgi:class 3 adenylate cyclase/tetratricopeptide (TPR) repeat protein
VKCPRCQAENKADARFCEDCGARLDVACPNCGTPVTPGKNFCRSCGAALTTEPTSRFASPKSYTPTHLAEKILTSKGALEGERKQVTVLFADLKGSMELLADRDPEEARKILDPVLEHMMEAVHRYEGTVNQVMGDGIMALFGAPLAHEDHAVRACYSALRIQEAMRRYTEDLRRTHGVEVQIRVGLNSGEVVVRSIGSDLRMDYTAVGQTTHLAARMEQLATPGTIRLTPETLALVEGYVDVKPLGPVPVKGLPAPVEVYELAGAAAAKTRLQVAHARGLTRFVGREAEMAEVRRAAEEVRRGRGQIVAVVGEPGVGKSRLFYEFRHSHHIHGWLALESNSVSYGKATPYLPLIDLLRVYLRVEAGDDTRTIRAKVTGTIITLDEALKEAIPPVLWLLDALPGDAPFLGLDPAERRRRTLAAVKAILLRESRVQPMVVVFEDLHWIDSETQAFLDSFVDSLPAAPIMLAVNYRPEYSHAWGSKTYYRQLRIDPLSSESAQDLLDALLGGDASVVPLEPLLIARTEGNPLFLEESVRTLVETGALTGSRGAYRFMKRLDGIAMPATVQAILAARIDRLAGEDKRLLQAAAVVGKDVPFALLLAIADVDEDGLRHALGRLQTAEFLYEARLFPELEYTFKHALTHEVAYGGLVTERRRALHAALVGAIEHLHADRLDEHVERLAHHALLGQVRDRAAAYLHQAGARAAARYANREALTLFEQALPVLSELPESPETLARTTDVRLALATTLVQTKGPGSPEAEAAYLYARELADRLGERTRLYQALWGLWYVNLGRGQYPSARELGEQLLVIAQRESDTGRLLEAHHALWPTLVAMGEPTAALLHLEQGLALYDPERHASQALLYGGHDAGVCCRFHLSWTQWVLGYPDRAAAAMRDALGLAERLAQPTTLALTLAFAAIGQYQRGEWRDARNSGERLHAIAETHGLTAPARDSLVYQFCAGVREGGEEGHFEKAFDAVMQRTIYGAINRWVETRLLLADAASAVGDVVRARRALDAIPAGQRDAGHAPEIHRIHGELLVRCDQRDEAEACFRRAIEIARRRSQRALELRAATSLARLLTQAGRRDEARRQLADIYTWFTEGFDTADLRAAKALLDELSAASK